MNLHPHLHFLVTEGGVDEAGVFHRIPRIDDSRLAELFARGFLSDLVRRLLLSPEWAERILSWRHTGFNVHSRVRAKTKREAGQSVVFYVRDFVAGGGIIDSTRYYGGCPFAPGAASNPGSSKISNKCLTNLIELGT